MKVKTKLPPAPKPKKGFGYPNAGTKPVTPTKGAPKPKTDQPTGGLLR